MVVLKVRFRKIEDFLDNFDSSGNGILFCPTTSAFEEGSRVIVDLRFPGLPNRSMILGTVLSWRSALPRLRVRAGARVAFEESERPKRDFLLDVAAGNGDRYRKRKHVRLPIHVPVAWRPSSSSDYEEGRLGEISQGGAFLKVPVSLPVGTEIVLRLDLPGSQAPMLVTGKVAYNLGGKGNGIRFIYRDGGGSRRIHEMLRRIQDTPF